MMRDWLQKQRLVHTQAGITLQEPLQAARLLGRVNSCLWGIFDVQASIVQQLTDLSELGHLLLFLYHCVGNRTSFIPAQLYHDIQAMIKNAFFR